MKKKNKINQFGSDVFNSILKETPIKMRLENCLYLNRLVETIIPDRQATEKEHKAAWSWSIKMTKKIMKHYQEWEKDGRPK